MNEPVEASCPYCGEFVELFVDEDGGRRQLFVEDCPVCCRPWNVEAVRHSAGQWSVDLRTSDE